MMNTTTWPVPIATMIATPSGVLEAEIRWAGPEDAPMPILLLEVGGSSVALRPKEVEPLRRLLAEVDKAVSA